MVVLVGQDLVLAATIAFAVGGIVEELGLVHVAGIAPKPDVSRSAWPRLSCSFAPEDHGFTAAKVDVGGM